MPLDTTTIDQLGLALHDGRHARARKQQRSFRCPEVQVMAAFGDERRTHGCQAFFLTHRELEWLAGDLGSEAAARLSRLVGAYVVVGEGGRIVTVAWFRRATWRRWRRR